MVSNLKRVITAITVLLAFHCPVHAKDVIPNLRLPKGSMVIEMESLRSKGYPNRAIALWMINPIKHPSPVEDDPDYLYTCPEETRGSYYSGLVRLSLINTKGNGIINTIELSEPFDIPYRIREGSYYHVIGKSGRVGESKAHILFLKDYNGDGQSLEFALFDAVACMGLSTALFGYSPQQDKIIQYPIRLEVTSGKEHSVTTLDWCDYLFAQKPRAPGLWKYCIDYRGRGGSLDMYEIRYNPQKVIFEGSLVSTEAEDAECKE